MICSPMKLVSYGNAFKNCWPLLFPREMAVGDLVDLYVGEGITLMRSNAAFSRASRCLGSAIWISSYMR